MLIVPLMLGSIDYYINGNGINQYISSVNEAIASVLLLWSSRGIYMLFGYILSFMMIYLFT